MLEEVIFCLVSINVRRAQEQIVEKDGEIWWMVEEDNHQHLPADYRQILFRLNEAKALRRKNNLITRLLQFAHANQTSSTKGNNLLVNRPSAQEITRDLVETMVTENLRETIRDICQVEKEVRHNCPENSL